MPVVDGHVAPAVARDHRFHSVRIAGIVQETAEAISLVLDIPAELREAFRYEAGQFCTFRASIDGQQQARCYSMSSAPGVDPDLQVTVKRVPGGIVSNWMNDTLAPGATIDVTCPAGVFLLTETDRDVVAFAGGSGITPVFSIVKTALSTTSRRVRLLYANRDTEAVIFAAELAQLAEQFGDRLHVAHHFDVDDGFVDEACARSFFAESRQGELYICGPGPFMDIVETALLAGGASAESIHVERFSPLEPVEETGSSDDQPAVAVTIEIGGRSGEAQYRTGTTVLQTARQLGLSPPFSCESGSCATCMAKLVSGSVTMHVNNALTDDEVADGWILTCQSIPTSPSVHVVYE
jgi:3-ketosteroid 9alpha-monooxygenase subunit B